MKTNKIISALLATLAVGSSISFTSCEDVMDTGSTNVMFEDNFKLDAASDTVYSVVGILSLVQKVADRVVLFGELRGELVDECENTHNELRQIMNFDMDKSNSYNKWGDFYDIINNCNNFLAKADTTLVQGTDSTNRIFKKEYAAVKGIRAWTYMQLAQIYGEVPFFTIPLNTVALSEKEYPRYNMQQLCDFFLNDLATSLDVEMPNYGQISNGSSTFDSKRFFFPLRLVLADYCLWCGYYTQAAEYYYQYIQLNRLQINGGYSVNPLFNANNRVVGYSDGWSGNLYDESVAFVPFASEKMAGTTTNLPNIFGSNIENDYKCPVMPSTAYVDLSDKQSYAYERSTSVYTLGGDMRRKGLYTPSFPGEEDEFGTTNNLFGNDEEKIFTCRKYTKNIAYVYRNASIYLRFAEAVNRAGYPSHAFAVLKCGLNTESIDRYVEEEEVRDSVYYLQFYSAAFNSNSTTKGLHSRGCGSTDKNTEYLMPKVSRETATSFDSIATLDAENNLFTIELTYHYNTDESGYYTTSTQLAGAVGEDEVQAPDTLVLRHYSKDYSVEQVEEMLNTEMALECSLEGTRFGDLMRVAMHRGNDWAWLADKVAGRKGTRDDALYNRLKDGNNLYFKLEE